MSLKDNFDIVVCGGSLGGVAAALAAARLGRRVLLTEETAWIGGQATTQGVPPDEHPWIESFGCTATYRAFRDGIAPTIDATTRSRRRPGPTATSIPEQARSAR